MKKTISISGMSCEHCVAKVESALKTVSGIEKVKVSLKKNLAEIKADAVDEQSIRDAVSGAGYTVTDIKSA